MGARVKAVDEKKFDYDAFKKDLMKHCNVTGTTLEKLSTDVFYRSKGWLSGRFTEKKLPVAVAVELCKKMNVPMKQYEITPQKKVEEEKKKEERKTETETGWTCQLRVDEEIGAAMVRILKDGEEIAVARSFIRTRDTLGILQGISYAAHQCYKYAEQRMLAEACDDAETKRDAIEDGSDEEPPSSVRVIFKDWVQKYEKENSKAGSMARYIKAHYQRIPPTGKKKIRSYFRLNGGDAHLQTFDTMWGMFCDWCNAQVVESNIRLGLG